MMYFKDGAFADDPFATATVLSAADWLERDSTAEASGIVLKLDPGIAVATVAADVHKFALIKIVFPKFTDGRGYSMGWLLRSRHGYKGEMRAVGDVLFDEMQLMLRCGFDAFEIVDTQTLRLLGDGRRAASFDRFYQPGLEPEMPAGTRPWARRSA